MTGSTPSRGEIITFYSYKGGTGRTMALANVACLLAERAEPKRAVLVVDWDLEAPGLHRFFPPRLGSLSATTDLGLDATPGIIDLFGALDVALPLSEPSTEEAADDAVKAAFESVDLGSFVADTAVPGVRIVRAGRNDDGQYSRRVSTFNWEHLFRRAPGVYRGVAERLATMFPYVLVDSRTGVTDISGICTSMVPEKLVVVFTPNRQSLSGIRDLVERATSYRRNSDDLRPLLIYPLPSRIEASREDLRRLWRLGSRDQNIAGYEPMFEELLAAAYGLPRCSLTEYFDAVQVQQTPDYAYGEEIAVRTIVDRFSLGDSYRIFTERLISGATPWAGEEEKRGAAAVTTAPPSPPPPPLQPPPPQPLPPTSASSLAAVETGRRKVFLSYARHDRDRVARIATALRSVGFDVWWDVDIAAGVEFDRAVADALDESEVVIVCWSRTSIASDSVIAEAGEGLRRGVLIPVLLDDVPPPLAFRSIQAADLRRDLEGGLKRLVQAMSQIPRASPGAYMFSVPPLASPGRARRSLRAFLALAATGVIIAAGFLFVRGWTRRVPNFVGLQVADVMKASDLLGVQFVLKDERGNETSANEGIVVAQSPAAEQLLLWGAPVRLTISSATVIVPTVVGMSLDAAVAALTHAQLRLATTESRPVGDAKAGTVIAQSPPAGTTVAAGSQVNMTVATPSRASPRLP